MIKVKLGELPLVLEGFDALSKIDLPVKAAYWTGKNMKKVVTEFQEFEKSRVALAEKFAEKDEQGKPVIKDNSYAMEDKAAYQAGFKELTEIEAEFDFPPLNLSQLEGVSIKGEVIFNLGPFIEDTV